ncbi:hypothetical protein C8R45DRAFT_991374 [Mycena sanguinolenta]|nr:hypothetical protein C8R45DRAFT_991374 [Mycena sanguinolenta]
MSPTWVGVSLVLSFVSFCFVSFPRFRFLPSLFRVFVFHGFDFSFRFLSSFLLLHSICFFVSLSRWSADSC